MASSSVRTIRLVCLSWLLTYTIVWDI